MLDISRRKREITLERKKAAEERRRFEEEKAKAETMTSALPINTDLDHRWANAKRQDYGAKQAGAKRSTGEEHSRLGHVQCNVCISRGNNINECTIQPASNPPKGSCGCS